VGHFWRGRGLTREGFARFEAQIRWGLVLFGCSVTRSGCAPTCGWLEACLPFERARIDDGLLLGESARNIVPDDADSVTPRFWKFVCTVSHASFFSHFAVGSKTLFGFRRGSLSHSVGAVPRSLPRPDCEDERGGGDIREIPCVDVNHPRDPRAASRGAPRSNAGAHDVTSAKVRQRKRHGHRAPPRGGGILQGGTRRRRVPRGCTV